MIKNRLFRSILSALILCTAIAGAYGMESQGTTEVKKEVKSLEQLAAKAVVNHAEAIGLIDQLHRLPDELAIYALSCTPCGYFTNHQDTVKQLIAEKKLNHSVLCELLRALAPEGNMQQPYAFARQLACDGRINGYTAYILSILTFTNTDIETLLQANNIDELFNMLFPAEILQHDNDTVIWHALRRQIFESPAPLFNSIFPHYFTRYTTKDEHFDPILQAQQQYRLQKQNDAEVILDEHNNVIAHIEHAFHDVHSYDHAIISSDRRFAVLYNHNRLAVYDLENQYTIMHAITDLDLGATRANIRLAFDEENHQLIIKMEPGFILTCPLPQELLECSFDLPLMSLLVSRTISEIQSRLLELLEKFLPKNHTCSHLFDMIIKGHKFSLTQARATQMVLEHLNINNGEELLEFVRNNPQDYENNIQQLLTNNDEFAQFGAEIEQNELMSYKRGD